jgi:hypothetical protein
MTEFTTTATGDRVAYDLRGAGPALIFVAGAGPFRAIDPWTTETAERAAQQGITTLVFDRLGRGESPAEGRLDLDRELDAIRPCSTSSEARPRCADTPRAAPSRCAPPPRDCPSTASLCGRLRSPASPLTHRRGRMRSSSGWTPATPREHSATT